MGRNHDGMLSPAASSRTPVSALRDPVFDALDRNHDGVISRTEWGAAMKKGGLASSKPMQKTALPPLLGDPVFNALDRNNDGLISRTEWAAAMREGGLPSSKWGLAICIGDNGIQEQ